MVKDIPQFVVGKVKVASAVDQEWLSNWGTSISSLEEQWRIIIGTSLSDGSLTYVAEACSEDE